MPDVPTLKEQGYPDLAANWSLYVVARTGTPLALRNRIATDIRSISREPKFVEEQFDRNGYTPIGDIPAQFADFLATNSAKQAIRVQAANVKLD